MFACNSPQLFAAWHVLHRFLMPRHSPCALYSLIFRLFLILFLRLSQNYILPFFTLCLRLISSPGKPHLCRLVCLISFRFSFRFLYYSVFNVLWCAALSGQNAWWAQVDSNHRPHAYQACALTCWAISPHWNHPYLLYFLIENLSLD